MSKILKIAAVALVLALGLGVTPAQATGITGSVTVTDGFNTAFLPCSPTTVVGGCTSIHHLLNGNTGPATFDYLLSVGVGNATLLTWVFGAPGATLNEINIPGTPGGFHFDITLAGVPVALPLICGATSCADGLLISIAGIVTATGFDPTAFTGTLALTGGCTKTATDTGCTGGFSGGYTYTLASAGQIVQVPEPGTLALLGLGLAGLGFASRRKKI